MGDPVGGLVDALRRGKAPALGLALSVSFRREHVMQDRPPGGWVWPISLSPNPARKDTS
jgi:hypothetical protein